MSQENLALRCGLARSYIGNLERGGVNPTLYNVLRIAVALDVDTCELVHGLPMPSPHA